MITPLLRTYPGCHSQYLTVNQLLILLLDIHMRGIFVFLRFPSDSVGYIIHQVGIYRVLISTCIGAYGVSKVSTLNVVSAVQQSTCWHRYGQIIRSFTFRRMPDCYQVVSYTPPEYCNGEQHHQDCDVSRVYSSTFKLIQTQLSLNCFCTRNRRCFFQSPFNQSNGASHWGLQSRV